MTDLSQLANIGEFVGGIAVLFTLIYLAVQIRQNTNVLKATSLRHAKNGFNRINMIIAQSVELTEIIDKHMYSYETLNPQEISRANWIWLSYTNIWETLFHEVKESIGHEEIWKSEERNIKFVFNLGGYRHWWRENQLGGTSEFRVYMDNLFNETEIRSNKEDAT